MGTTRARGGPFPVRVGLAALAATAAAALAGCGSSPARTGATPPATAPDGGSAGGGPTGVATAVPRPAPATPGSPPAPHPGGTGPSGTHPSGTHPSGPAGGGPGPGATPRSGPPAGPASPPGPLPTSAAGLAVLPPSRVPGPVPRACLPPGFVLPEGSVAVRGTAESPCRPGSGTFYVQVRGARQDVVVSFLKTVYAARWTPLAEVLDKRVVVVGGSAPRNLVGNTQVWQERPTRGRMLTFTTYALAGVTTVQVVYSDGVPPP